MAVPTQFAVLLLCAACLNLPSIQAVDVKYCDNSANYAVVVKGVDITPDPVATGQPATFNITASTGDDICGGKVRVEVFYFGFHVHTESCGLCEEVSCPISAGAFVLSHTQTLPGFTPPGSYTLKMDMKDDKNQRLTCISFDFKIGLGSSVADS